MVISVSTIGSKIVETLGPYLLKRNLDKLFNNTEDFQTRLSKVIGDTINEYRELNPIASVNEKFAFYESSKIVEELLRYRIMRDEYNISDLQSAFDNISNIITPQTADIECFYDTFIKNVNSDDKLKQLEISATFSHEIFNISQKLDSLNRNIENVLNEIETQLESEWKRQINVYKDNIDHFRPRTALALLVELESSFGLSRKKPSTPILATIEFLKAQCHELLGEKDKAYKSFIKAFQLLPINKIFKEKACYAYYRISEIGPAIKLVEEILEQDSYNSIAWAMKVLTSENDDLNVLLSSVPHIVLRDKDFRRILFFNTYTNKKYSEPLKILEKYSIIPDIREYDNSPLTINNLNDKIFWIECKLSEYMRKMYFDFNKIDDQNLDLLKLIKLISNQLLDGIKDSEIADKFKIVEFFSKYSDFVLTGNKSAVLAMRLLYPSLVNPDKYFMLILANSLQICGEISTAIELINSQKSKCIESLHLEAFCHLKNQDTDNYIKISKEILQATSSIDNQSIMNILSRIDKIFIFDKINEISNEMLLQVLEFESPSLKVLLTSFLNVLKNENYKTAFINLQSIEKEILETDLKIFFYIPYSFYLLEKYDLAIDSFRKYISFDFESRDLLIYILSLERSATHHKELLSLLAKWRNDFSFNEDLLRYEGDLRCKLCDWENCLKIAEYFVSVHGPAESFMTLELMSLNEIERTYRTQRIQELANHFKTHTFREYVNALIVSRILIENGYHEIALEILYNKAIDRGNVDARTHYFLSMVHMPEGIIKEKDFVDNDSYVKYLFNDGIKFVEIKKDKVLAKELLGREKGDVITLTRPIVKSSDTIRILRIMDKYLSLHDEILEDVRNNPYSGFPMQSFNFNTEDIAGSLISMFGDEGSRLKESQDLAFRDYYTYKMSFTEIVIRNYSSNYLTGYYHLVHFKEGITTIPLYEYPDLKIDSSIEIVIDLSSLPILFQISNEHTIEFKHKFLISKGTVETIKSYIKEEHFDPNEKMSLKITLEGIDPIINKQMESESNTIFLKRLLEWIEINCVISIVESKLDIIMNLTEELRKEAEMLYVVEVFSLLLDKENRVLVTDDSIYFKLLPLSNCKLCSSELYAKSTLDHSTSYFEEFRKNKYIGFTSTSDDKGLKS